MSSGCLLLLLLLPPSLLLLEPLTRAPNNRWRNQLCMFKTQTHPQRKKPAVAAKHISSALISAQNKTSDWIICFICFRPSISNQWWRKFFFFFWNMVVRQLQKSHKKMCQQAVMRVCLFAVTETKTISVPFLVWFVSPGTPFPSQYERRQAPGTGAEITSKDDFCFENRLHYCLATKVSRRRNGNGQFRPKENGNCQIKIYKYDTRCRREKKKSQQQYDEWPGLSANWQILTSHGSEGVLEYWQKQNKWLKIDCGKGFTDSELPITPGDTLSFLIFWFIFFHFFCWFEFFFICGT